MQKLLCVPGLICKDFRFLYIRIDYLFIFRPIVVNFGKGFNSCYNITAFPEKFRLTVPLFNATPIPKDP
jgi:hypothetical protein